MGQVTHLLNHSLSLERKARTSNGRGGHTEAYAEVTTMKGRVVPANGRDQQVGRQHQAKVTHAVYLEPSSDVRVNDRVVFGSRYFRVLVPNSDTPSIPIYQKLLTEEVQRG